MKLTKKQTVLGINAIIFFIALFVIAICFLGIIWGGINGIWVKLFFTCGFVMCLNMIVKHGYSEIGNEVKRLFKENQKSQDKKPIEFCTQCATKLDSLRHGKQLCPHCGYYN